MQKLLTATKNTYKSYKRYRNDNEQKQSGKITKVAETTTNKNKVDINQFH
jgi:hypothetical protein